MMLFLSSSGGIMNKGPVIMRRLVYVVGRRSPSTNPLRPPSFMLASSSSLSSSSSSWSYLFRPSITTTTKPKTTTTTGSIQFFSTESSSSSAKKEEKDEAATAATEPPAPQGFWETTKHQIMSVVFTPQNQFYALVAGGSVGAYIISRGVLSFTSFFTHLTPTTIAKWGFYTGFGTASLLGGLTVLTLDNLYIRADPVFQYCSNWVRNDPKVQAALGDGLQPGSLRSYRLDSGKIELKQGNNNALVWRPPRIQMIFDITATGPPYRTGLVTCEAVKVGAAAGRWYWPSLQTTLLKVDYETGNEHQEGGTTEGDETIYLRGTKEDVDRISKRSGLSLAMLARSVHINRAAAGK